MDIINSERLEEMYQGILKDADFAEELDDYQLFKVKEYANSEKARIGRMFYVLINSNPDFWLGPEEEIKGNKLDNLLRTNQDYQKAEYVLIIIQKLAA